MGRVFKPYYTKSDGRGGRVRVPVKDWYAEYTDAAGAQRRERVGRDRRTAESALARLQERAARVRLNVPDPLAEAAARSRDCAGLMTEYLADLADRGRAETYRREATRMLGVLVAACGWNSWSDVTEPGMVRFMARQRASSSPATANGYLRVAKAFANWYADRIGARSPLKGVEPFNERVDRRRSRRVLTDAELDKLCDAAARAPRRHNCRISGPDRAVLYRVAAHTGLRASELASLTPAHFDLDGPVPVVTVEAKDSKGRREEPVPLCAELVALLTDWFRGKPRTARLWPGKWAEHRRQVRWVERDAARAGLGTGVLFHRLRAQFVTRLVRSGADVDQVRRLARHKSVQTTLNHYTESDLADLARTVNRAKPLG